MKPRSGQWLERCGAWLAANERNVIWAFALLLLAVNLCSSTLYPTSWMDEAMFSDPAINFANGRGFVSTAWWQSRHLVWSGNVPLYTTMLVPWIKLFGGGLVPVRAFNAVLISLVIPLFWLGIKRLDCIPSAAARIALVVTVFLSFPLCFPYRSARTDVASMLLCAWALWAWTAKNEKVRNACLYFAGFLMPASGLQLIGYFGLLCMVVFLLEGKPAVGRLLVLGVGVFSGALALLLFYYFNHLTGVLETIREAHRLHNAAVLGQNHETMFSAALVKLKRTAGDHLSDYGIMPTLAALLLLASLRPVWSDKRLRLLALIAIGSSFALVATLEITLHYLGYYHWMNYIILAITVFVIAGRVWHAMHPLMKTAVVFLIVCSAVGGLPIRLLVEAALRQGRQYAQLQDLVRKNIQATDVVFTDYMGYFPAKMRAEEVYLPSYSRVMTEEERRSVNVLLLDAQNHNGYYDLFADTGRWKKTGSIDFKPSPAGKWILRLMPHYMNQPTSCGYSVMMLRREPEPPAAQSP